jgi:hypothetical protein
MRSKVGFDGPDNDGEYGNIFYFFLELSSSKHSNRIFIGIVLFSKYDNYMDRYFLDVFQ